MSAIESQFIVFLNSPYCSTNKKGTMTNRGYSPQPRNVVTAIVRQLDIYLEAFNIVKNIKKNE